MEFDWWSQMEWLFLFLAAYAAVVVVCTVIRSSHCVQSGTDHLQLKKLFFVSRTGRPQLRMILKKRLRMGNADDESDHSFLLV